MADGMRLVLLAETFHPATGGGETQARTLATGLAAEGAEVLVITRRTDGNLPSSDALGPVRIRRLPPRGPGQLKKWGLVITAFLVLLRLHRSYDAVLVCGFRVLGIPSVLATKILRKPCVLKAESLGEFSGDIFSAGLRRLGASTSNHPFRLLLQLRNRLLSEAHAFVATSSAVERELVAGGLEGIRIHRIPNCVDVDRFAPVSDTEKMRLRETLRIPGQARVGIYTGRLVSTKGLPLLLSVWTRLVQRHSNALLLLVGSGSLDLNNCERDLRDFVTRKSLQRSVLFTGSVENVHEYLGASDFFVFPSERENFSVSVIEAMACGLPVIATCVGGLADFVAEGATALVVRPGDADGLEHAIERALVGDKRLREMGLAGREVVRKRYSERQVLGQYTALLKEL